MVFVDDEKNIQRIIDVIKSDPDLYPATEQNPNLLRQVIFGDPPSNVKKSINEKPAVYVTTRDETQLTRYGFGTSVAENPNQVTIEYEIVLLAQSRENTEKSQRQLVSH